MAYRLLDMKGGPLINVSSRPRVKRRVRYPFAESWDSAVPDLSDCVKGLAIWSILVPLDEAANEPIF